MKKINVDLKVIGIVHSPYKNVNDAPRQGRDEIVEIEVFKEFTEGVKDIQGFSHLHIFYWLHLSKDFHLIVNTPWDVKSHGVFTTRSPRHPNPLGYSVVELVSRKENILKIKGLDAIDGTLVIDIKPYIKKFDCKNNAVSGWSEGKIDL